MDATREEDQLLEKYLAYNSIYALKNSEQCMTKFTLSKNCKSTDYNYIKWSTWQVFFLRASQKSVESQSIEDTVSNCTNSSRTCSIFAPNTKYIAGSYKSIHKQQIWLHHYNCEFFNKKPDVWLPSNDIKIEVQWECKVIVCLFPTSSYKKLTR